MQNVGVHLLAGPRVTTLPAGPRVTCPTAALFLSSRPARRSRRPIRPAT
jgi:hypothetical protein